MNGYETMRRLRADRRLADIPAIFVTARTDEGSELEGSSLGAVDYVSKPFSAPLLLKRIENHLESALQKRNWRATTPTCKAWCASRPGASSICRIRCCVR
ncbi:MAG: response regulator [Zoogloeaceae bacterium]|nr:response regulator [Zoogloeaceae bacterium]